MSDRRLRPRTRRPGRSRWPALIAAALWASACGPVADDARATDASRSPAGDSVDGDAPAGDGPAGDALVGDARDDSQGDPQGDSQGDSQHRPPPTEGSVRIAFNALPAHWLGGPEALWKGVWTPFFWAVPPVGWTVEVHVAHDGSWQPSASPTLTWSRSVDGLGGPGSELPPDALDAAQRGWQVEAGGHRWQARITQAPPALAARTDGTDGTDGTGGADGDMDGPLWIGAAVQGISAPSTALQVATFSAKTDPFEQVDSWLLTTSRDLGAIVVAPQKTGGFAVTTPKPWTPNGVPDLEDALQVLGMMGGGEAWRSALLARLKLDLHAHLRAFYHLDPSTGLAGPDSVRVRFVFESEAGAPPAPAKAGWSQMAIGGDDPTFDPKATGAKKGKFLFGQAAVDPWNQTANNNTTKTRGVFTTSFARFVLGNPVLAGLVSDVAPASGGTPYGSDPAEIAWLAVGFDPMSLPEGPTQQRALLFRTVWRFLTLALAAVTAHEVGHSLGLVMPGLPPYGLLAGAQKGPGLETIVDTYHIDTAGFNLMQPGSSFDAKDLLTSQARFGPANLAWLRRRLVVLPVP